MVDLSKWDVNEVLKARDRRNSFLYQIELLWLLIIGAIFSRFGHYLVVLLANTDHILLVLS